MTRITHHILSLFLTACALTLLSLGSVTAQENSEPRQLQVSVLPWNISCDSAANGAGLDCQMSRAMVLTENNQLLVRLTVNLAAANPYPSFLLLVPNGI